MPDSPNSNRDPRQNAAWQAAQQWRERARQTRPTGLAGSFKLLLTWLLFGAMMIIAMVLGLFLLLVGWAMLPFLRLRMKKRMEQMRADQAQGVGGGVHYRETHYRETRTNGDAYREQSYREQSYGEQQVLEGDYEVKPEQDTSKRDTTSR
ncbi:hypothetical protein KG088_09235 [Halomonas sp. TRM85114]|uniref:hypothetical protein n=1 Tax=Halomonas jincaotanensis TaxID=2810616 RepID=UPI001BD513BA|nr:hypothetical protein [Halomonas jincaotanensis]MBS9403813.1 hypothetical protein [Halomonas jincaotanensis]